MVCNRGLYDILTLHCFHRPVKERARVPPDELRRYRSTHQYLGPSCLCPLLEPISENPVFREAAIYLSTSGCYKGEYVAECAKNRCGYLGQSPSFPQRSECSHVLSSSTVRENVPGDWSSSEGLSCERLVSIPHQPTSITNLRC